MQNRTTLSVAAPRIAAHTDELDQCLCLRVVGHIDDHRIWSNTVSRLLDCAHRRWHDRDDVADHPALQRWSRVQAANPSPDQPSLRAVFALPAAGQRIDTGDALADFATAIMLLSSCPATATPCADTQQPPESIDFAVYAYRDDDLPLAETLITTSLAACGIVLARTCVAVLPSRRVPAAMPAAEPVPAYERLRAGSPAA
ncbi:hypothetical protein [Nocardia camponoti]|uniref:Uncharacterized protein n=1 Tax=Nocardia camponoti TaxID=1616106 RepID=A0A917Q9C3_9NOCA|nr:hypothetical protein [Nocardia camponoti]GGK37960.1 hypothetical protein GCM10011591_06940 [Nocardia camponoti]